MDVLDLESMEASANALLEDKPEAEAAEDTAQPTEEQTEAEALEQPEAEDPEENDADTEAESAEGEKPVNHAHQRISARKRAEAAEAKARELELEIARLKGRDEVLAKPAQEPKQEVAAPEDEEPEADTLEHLEWQIRQAQKEASTTRAEMQALLQQQREAQEIAQWQIKSEAIAKQNPVFDGAIKHLRERAIAGLKQQYPQAPESELRLLVQKGEANYVRELAAKGVTPEAVLLGEAIQAGYVHNPAPATPPKPQSNKAEVQFAKRNAGTVASVGAGSGDGRLSAEDISRMSIEAIMAMPEDKYRAAFSN